jgi:signal transduction histidine kinase
MKSIRLSLTVYFLILLGLALGTGFGVMYQNMRQTLQEKTDGRRHLLEVVCENQSKQLLKEFDDHLLRRARTLANLAQSQWTHTHLRPDYYALGLLTAVPSPQAHVVAPLWIAESGRDERGFDTPFSRQLRWISFTKINFAEDVMPRDEEASQRTYFQVYSHLGIPLQRSRSMGKNSFVLDPAQHAGMELFDPIFDDTHLDGVSIRRVTLKTPIARFRTDRPIGPPPPPGRSFRTLANRGREHERNRFGPDLDSAQGSRELEHGPKPERYPEAPEHPNPPVFREPGPGPRLDRNRGGQERAAPAIFIQCAADTSQRDQTLAEYQAQLAKDLNQSTTEASESLEGLRYRLWWIGAATFAAALIGSCLLVGLGLSPLRRLSEAVSRVSERDMTLQCKPAELPPELRPIAERVAQTLELLQRAFARERQAAADISHELRTPLAALLTTLEVGLRRQRSPEEYTELLQDCHAIGQQMTQLVERLLALARIDAGVDAVRPEEVDVVSLARQCVSLVRPLAEARHLTLELHCQEPRHLLHTDPGKLREVLTNLLHNAVDYNRPQGRIDVALVRENGSLHVSVADTGIGISPEAQAHIFERFYRADQSRQAEGLHAGVGLSIVKGYVELMGGAIAVQSRENEGSTFRLTLPVASAM